MARRISICGSLDFSHDMGALAERLKSMGFEVTLPPSAELILNKELTVETVREEKEGGTFHDRAIRHDAIRRYWNILKDSDAILVANYDKKGVKGYIGGNSFLEMGFAHILHKPIFLLNDIPAMGYTDEIKAMEPVCLNGDLNRLNSEF